MTLLELIVLGLATWRLASLLSHEDGPWHVFAWIRQAAGVRYDEMSEPYGVNQVAKGLLCLWCCSVWIGAALAVLWWLAPDITFLLCLPLALSAGAVVVEERLVK